MIKDINWIDCGLPFNCGASDELKNYPEFPQEELDVLTKEKFGISATEIQEKISQYSKILIKINELRAKFSYEKDHEELINFTDDKEIIDYIRLRRQLSEIREWENQSSIVDSYRQQIKEARSKFNRKSFYPDLAKPGTLIELESGKQLLIGHINNLGGVCDACIGVNGSDIIKRYAVIINFDKDI